MKPFVTLGFSAILLWSNAFAETKVKVEDLPAAVQKTVKEQTANATVSGVSKEREGGKIVYEVETKVAGKGRDLMIAGDGRILSVEQETPIESIPAPAREAILKKAAGGKIKMVETVTEGAGVSYEVSFTGKSGRTVEYAVNADGTVHK